MVNLICFGERVCLAAHCSGLFSTCTECQLTERSFNVSGFSIESNAFLWYIFRINFEGASVELG